MEEARTSIIPNSLAMKPATEMPLIEQMLEQYNAEYRADYGQDMSPRQIQTLSLALMRQMGVLPYEEVAKAPTPTLFDTNAYRRELEARRKATATRLRQKYGALSDADIAEISSAECELNACQDCTGNCMKAKRHYQVPVISVASGRATITIAPCKNAELRQAQRLKSSHIPARYIGSTFADYTADSNNREAVTWARQAVSTGKGAFLHGERGVGKTFLASIVAQEFLKAGKATVFIKVPALLSDIRDTYNGKSRYTEAELLSEACNTPVLILDDIGMEKATKFAGATLCRIIDARYDKQLTTILTSNYTLEGMRRELDNATDGANYNGSRIADRLSEMCAVIHIKGSSRRK